MVFEVDEATREIIRYGLIQATEEMKIKLIKASSDVAFYEAKDFSVGLFNKRGELLAQASGLPHFLGNLGQAIVEIAKDIGGYDVFEPGDVYLSNDPYNVTLHLPDMTVVAPIFLEDELVAFSSVRGHWLGIGSASPFNIVDAENMFQEGNLFKSIKAFEKGKPVDQVIRLIRYNCRLPDRMLNNLFAQRTACYVGDQRIKYLIERFGKKVFLRSMEAILDHGEKFAKARVMEIPEGEYDASGYWDDDGINLDVPLPIQVKVTVKGVEVLVDLTGSSGRVKGSANCGRAQSITECRWAYCSIIAPTQPVNDGMFRPLKVIIPENSIFNAKFPDATYLGYGPADVAKDLILTSLAEAVPKKVAAPNYGQMANAGIYGMREKTGEMWMGIMMMAGGSGGNYYNDGANAMTFGDLANQPQEKIERDTPVRVLRYTLPMDSEGPGKHRGGFGLLCEVQYIGKRWSKDDPSINIGSVSFAGRGKNAPTWGILGGMSPDPPNYISLNSGTSKEVDMFRKTGYPINEGDILKCYACGGGGYGDPLERNPQLVRKDVVEELVSLRRAKEVYGVIFNLKNYEVNKEETRKLRREMGKKPK